MVNMQEITFKRRIGCERAMLMLPFNVVLAARIRGEVQPSAVRNALEKLRARHPFLNVRLQMEPDGSAYFIGDNVPAVEVCVNERQSEYQWQTCVQRELRTSFELTRGPLVRCSLVHSPDGSDIVLCAHHAICDGMSLGYLLRDILTLIASPEHDVGEPLVPPAVVSSNVPTPPKSNWFMHLILNTINSKWSSKGIHFSEEDRKRMHDEFWRVNGTPQLMAWSLGNDLTSQLVQKCRDEKVTVNSALWTAFLAAQDEVHSHRPPFRRRSAMAVNTRDKLLFPSGESFGFFASSLTVRFGCSSDKSFWDNARGVHTAIRRELGRTNLFRMLISDMIHPTLLDSLYFQKYGLINESIPKKFLRKMGWHKITYGCALTNVGRFNIPTSYGALELEGVYGPLFYSDVEEKMVGTITVGGNLSFLMAVNRSLADIAEDLRATVQKKIEDAAGGTPS